MTTAPTCPLCGWEGKRLGMHVKKSHVEYSQEEFYNKFLIGKIEGHRVEKHCLNLGCNNSVEFHMMSRGYRQFCSGYCQTKYKWASNSYYRERVSLSSKKTMEKLWGDPEFAARVTAGGEKRAGRKNPGNSERTRQRNLTNWKDPEYRKQRAEASSLAMKKAWERGAYRGRKGESRGVSGTYESTKAGVIHYRSSWERRYYSYLDGCDDVQSYLVEPFPIPYTYEGKHHSYYPDLLVEYKDGTRELIEITTQWQFTSDRQKKYKIAVGVKYAEENGLQMGFIMDFDNTMIKIDGIASVRGLVTGDIVRM